MKSKYYYTNKIFSCLDIIKLISQYKHEMEYCIDIEKLNQVGSFQSLVYHLFRFNCDCGVIIRNRTNNERLVIKICKCKQPLVLVMFKTFEKYKRLPYYIDTLFLNFNNSPIHNQNILAQHILNDNIIFNFFKYKQMCNCSH